MLSREEIVRMIQEMDTADRSAMEDVKRAMLLLAQTDDIAEAAAAVQLRGQVLSGVIVKSSRKKGIDSVYETAQNIRRGEENDLLQELISRYADVNRALTFRKVFNGSLTGHTRSILRQKFIEKKKKKEIVWQGRSATMYEIDKACSEGITILQQRMAAEGYESMEST